eukprot:1611710-Prymnesium_polylepis.1
MHEFLPSRLRSCFWTGRVAAYILPAPVRSCEATVAHRTGCVRAPWRAGGWARARTAASAPGRGTFAPEQTESKITHSVPT